MQLSTRGSLWRALDRHLVCRSLLALVISGMAWCSTAGCGHITPYYGPDASWPAVDTLNEADVRYRVLLIGDAGEPDASVLYTLYQWAKILPHKTLLVFLGDNIYPHGMPAGESPTRQQAERRLWAQMNVVQESGAHALFLPGNHDWASGGKDGLQAIREQAAYINQRLSGSANVWPKSKPPDSARLAVADHVAGMGTATFLPTPGCPGPAKVDLDGVRIIALDTHWWLHKHHNQSIGMCVEDREAYRRLQSAEQNAAIEAVKGIVVKKLQEYVHTAGARQVIVVAHHPLATYGLHGGFYSWQDHLFPLTRLVQWLWIPTPIVGSLYPFGRWHWVKSDQDLAGRNNQDMVRRLREALQDAPAHVTPLIYAAGHEHSLQVLKGKVAAYYILVSGAGARAKITAVNHDKAHTLFAHSHPGFMAVDITQKHRVLLRIIEPGGHGVVFFKWFDKIAPQVQ